MPWLPVLHTPGEDLVFFGRAIGTSEVWVVGDPVCAFIAFRPGWIDHLYVEPERFGRGIGSLLLAKALEDRSERSLWVFERNTIARAFYERHGFEPVRRTDGSGNEEREPDVLYACAPGQAATSERTFT